MAKGRMSKGESKNAENWVVWQKEYRDNSYKPSGIDAKNGSFSPKKSELHQKFRGAHWPKNNS